MDNDQKTTIILCKIRIKFVCELYFFLRVCESRYDAFTLFRSLQPNHEQLRVLLIYVGDFLALAPERFNTQGLTQPKYRHN
jgi:hypothetical protein